MTDHPETWIITRLADDHAVNPAADGRYWGVIEDWADGDPDRIPVARFANRRHAVDLIASWEDAGR